MAKPNFFVVGAPKCGTTSIFEYLRTHPDVFFPRIKEPHYFASDFPAYRTVHTEADYLALFETAESRHRAIGDASVFYLYSSQAVPNILRFDPAARMVVMLRNPVDLVHSLHSQFLYGFREDEKNFRKAWELQPLRRMGQRLPRHCMEPSHLQYASVGRLGEQVARLLNQVDAAQVRFFLFDDLNRAPAVIYAELLEFLGLTHDNRNAFPTVNPNRTHRSERLAKLLMRPPFPLNLVKMGFKRALRLQNTRLSTTIYQYNQVLAPRTPLNRETREMVAAEFASDIDLLEQLIGKDLDHWRKDQPGSANFEIPSPS